MGRRRAHVTHFLNLFLQLNCRCCFLSLPPPPPFTFPKALCNSFSLPKSGPAPGTSGEPCEGEAPKEGIVRSRVSVVQTWGSGEV